MRHAPYNLMLSASWRLSAVIISIWVNLEEVRTCPRSPLKV